MLQPDPVREKYIATLEDENETLRERIKQLEKMLGFHLTVPLAFNLTGKEGALLGYMLTRDLISKANAIDALYGDRHIDREIPMEKIVDVFICKMRVKLKKFDIPIETVWGQGYRMTPAAKAKVAEYVALETQVA